MLKISIGLVLLFAGLFMFTGGLKSLAVKDWLDPVAPMAMLFCALGFTAVFQSSSLTTVVLVSMVAARTISLEVAIAGVIGANIGTVVTACLIASPLGLEAKRLAMAHLIFNVTAGIGAYMLLERLSNLCKILVR